MAATASVSALIFSCGDIFFPEAERGLRKTARKNTHNHSECKKLQSPQAQLLSCSFHCHQHPPHPPTSCGPALVAFLHVGKILKFDEMVLKACNKQEVQPILQLDYSLKKFFLKKLFMFPHGVNLLPHITCQSCFGKLYLLKLMMQPIGFRPLKVCVCPRCTSPKTCTTGS